MVKEDANQRELLKDSKTKQGIVANQMRMYDDIVVNLSSEHMFAWPKMIE